MYHVTWLVPVMVTKGTLVRVNEFLTHKPVAANVTVAGSGGCHVGSFTLMLLMLGAVMAVAAVLLSSVTTGVVVESMSPSFPSPWLQRSL